MPIAEGMGFCRLPAPSPADLFVDLEGDPFVGESGFQYLFGLAYRDAGGRLAYEKRWALDRAQEKAAFEWLVDEIMHRRAVTPGMHVYHFGAYEPAALKRLMGMYATREDEIDRMLRAGVLVDLHQVFKQALRASVEEYSLKKLEAFYGFERKTPLDESRAAMRYIEHRMELGRMANELPESIRDAMEGYDSEDCFSTSALRDWVEQERRTALDQGLSAARFVDLFSDDFLTRRRAERNGVSLQPESLKCRHVPRHVKRDLSGKPPSDAARMQKPAANAVGECPVSVRRACADDRQRSGLTRSQI